MKLCEGAIAAAIWWTPNANIGSVWRNRFDDPAEVRQVGAAVKEALTNRTKMSALTGYRSQMLCRISFECVKPAKTAFEYPDPAKEHNDSRYSSGAVIDAVSR